MESILDPVPRRVDYAEFKPAEVARISPWYAHEVRLTIARMLLNVVRMATYAAKKEGFGRDVRNLLAFKERELQQRLKRLDHAPPDRPCRDGVHSIALTCMVWADARIALGVEHSDKPSTCMLAELAHWVKVAEQTKGAA